MTEDRAVKLGNFKTETVEPSRWATGNTFLCVVLSAFKIVIRIPLTVCHICQVEQRLNTFKARGGEVGHSLSVVQSLHPCSGSAVPAPDGFVFREYLMRERDTVEL